LLWLVLITCSSFRENLPSFLWQGQISKTSILLSFSFRWPVAEFRNPNPPPGLTTCKSVREESYAPPNPTTENNSRERAAMQQAMSMPPGAAGAVPPPASITTEQIQKVRSAPPRPLSFLLGLRTRFPRRPNT
jgi:hypothetical protein